MGWGASNSESVVRISAVLMACSTSGELCSTLNWGASATLMPLRLCRYAYAATLTPLRLCRYAVRYAYAATLTLLRLCRYAYAVSLPVLRLWSFVLHVRGRHATLTPLR